MSRNSIVGFVVLTVTAVLCAVALAQPPMKQAGPTAGQGPTPPRVTQPAPAEDEAQPAPGPAVAPGTLKPAQAGGVAATESGPESAAAKPAPGMAHTGANLLGLYAISLMAVVAGALLWFTSRRQLRPLA